MSQGTKLLDKDIELLVKLHKRGVKIASIARKLDVSRQTVYRYLESVTSDKLSSCSNYIQKDRKSTLNTKPLSPRTEAENANKSFVTSFAVDGIMVDSGNIIMCWEKSGNGYTYDEIPLLGELDGIVA